MTPRFRLKAQLSKIYVDSDQAYRAAILAEAARAFETTVMLDAGCDDGVWTSRVVAAVPGNPLVVGIESEPDRADLARDRGIDARVGDLEGRWPVDDTACDLVHANQVIEHVKRLDHFVGETAHVLRPGGRAIICTENLASWHNVVAAALGWMPFSLTNISGKGPIGNPLALHIDDPSVAPESWQHIHVLTLRGLCSIFELHGFRIDRRFGGGYYPLWGRSGRWMARHDPRHAHFIGITATKGPAPPHDRP